ncbi:MAG: 30S ribosomal protein S19 [bacterium]
MGRSIRKGPYIDEKLFRRIRQLLDAGEKRTLKTYARRSVIPPEFVGQTIAVHNGNRFLPVYVTERMVGHRLGEFAPTRTFRQHSGQRKEKAEEKKK